MSELNDQSAGISPRRALLEEVLEERSKVVAGLPIDEQDPGSGSPLWPLGAARLANGATFHMRSLVERRVHVLALCVMALAWLERVDEELRAREVSPGP